MFSCICNCSIIFFFFKQKTAYEMRISDWSSDVCSSDLLLDQARRDDDVSAVVLRVNSPGGSVWASEQIRRAVDQLKADGKPVEIGRASCRERVCQYV